MICKNNCDFEKNQNQFFDQVKIICANQFGEHCCDFEMDSDSEPTNRNQRTFDLIREVILFVGSESLSISKSQLCFLFSNRAVPNKLSQTFAYLNHGQPAVGNNSHNVCELALILGLTSSNNQVSLTTNWTF